MTERSTDRIAGRLISNLRSRHFFSQLRRQIGRQFRPFLREQMGDEWLGTVEDLIRHPRTIGAWLQQSSLLSAGPGRLLKARILDAASNLEEPFTIGMGLRVARITDEEIEVLLPDRWHNRGEDGGFHQAAIGTLAEHGVRLLWDQHLDRRTVDLSVRAMELQRTSTAQRLNSQQLRAVSRLPLVERESILHRLRSESGGTFDFEALTRVYDSEQLLVAEVTIKLRLHYRRVLSSPGMTGGINE